MRNWTFNKIGKIVAVSAGIVLMGVIFSGCSMGFFSEVGSAPKIAPESCKGNGTITMQSSAKIGSKTAFKEVGECKNRLKEGVWKHYDSNDNVLQETTYTKGLRNGATKIYDRSWGKVKVDFYQYVNGEMVGELKNKKVLYLYDKTIYGAHGGYIKKYRKYDIESILAQDKVMYDKKIIQPLKDKNAQIEQENNQMKLETEQNAKKAKEIAIENAKQRAQSKVKKPTMQEVAKSKGIMDAYREKLKAQEEKELQIELAKIQTPQISQKQLYDIPQYKEPKLDTYEEILAFVKDKKYTLTEIVRYIATKIESSQDSDGKNFKSKLQRIDAGRGRVAAECNIENDKFNDNDCWTIKKYGGRWFGEGLKASMFKDKINAILPN